MTGTSTPGPLLDDVGSAAFPGAEAFAVRAREHALFAAGDPVAIARAPGRFDVLGGIADYAGGLVLALPIRDAALAAAQGAAGEIRAKAEENVARLLREARDESQQMREDAESVLSRKTGEAEEAAAAIRAEAEGVIEKARAEAADLVEAGRQEGRDMVAEAQKVRQRMLDDLSRRRKLLRQQIEQLQAGRERLLAAYDQP